MPRMASSFTIGANAVSSNQLAGLLEEFSRSRTRLRMAYTSAATGVNATAILNDVVIENDQFISLINRFPQIPEDVAIDHRMARGARAVVTFRNTTGAGIVVFWAVDTQNI